MLKGGAPNDEEELHRLENLYTNSKSPAVRMGLKFKIDALKKKLLEKDDPPVSSGHLKPDFSNMYKLVDFNECASVSSSVKAVSGETDMSTESEENEPKVYNIQNYLLECYRMNDVLICVLCDPSDISLVLLIFILNFRRNVRLGLKPKWMHKVTEGNRICLWIQLKTVTLGNLNQ